jgi:hypothetical protein
MQRGPAETLTYQPEPVFAASELLSVDGEKGVGIEFRFLAEMAPS